MDVKIWTFYLKNTIIAEKEGNQRRERGRNMKKRDTASTVLLAVLTGVLYGIQAAFFVVPQVLALPVFGVDAQQSYAVGEICGNIIILLTFASVLLIIANIVYAIVTAVLPQYDAVLAGNAVKILIFKLVLIPFCLLNFFVWFAVTCALLVVPGLQMLLGISGMAILWTYGIMLATSVYGVGMIVRMWRRKKITTAFMVILIILQFIFVADIIGYVIFYSRCRKGMKEAAGC